MEKTKKVDRQTQNTNDLSDEASDKEEDCNVVRLPKAKTAEIKIDYSSKAGPSKVTHRSERSASGESSRRYEVLYVPHKRKKNKKKKKSRRRHKKRRDEFPYEFKLAMRDLLWSYFLNKNPSVRYEGETELHIIYKIFHLLMRSPNLRGRDDIVDVVLDLVSTPVPERNGVGSRSYMEAMLDDDDFRENNFRELISMENPRNNPPMMRSVGTQTKTIISQYISILSGLDIVNADEESD